MYRAYKGSGGTLYSRPGRALSQGCSHLASLVFGTGGRRLLAAAAARLRGPVPVELRAGLPLPPVPCKAGLGGRCCGVVFGQRHDGICDTDTPRAPHRSFGSCTLRSYPTQSVSTCINTQTVTHTLNICAASRRHIVCQQCEDSRRRWSPVDTTAAALARNYGSDGSYTSGQATPGLEV